MQPPEEPRHSPLWAPPRAPLPPYRLASIANALGLPIPAVRGPPTRAHSESGSLPARSPTPSGSAPSPSTSKYLLHVIPPVHLPHVTGGRARVPPPPPANGYHTQFRRGVLVPLYASFQTQLAAIAKEYALPSTTGMVLYLASPSRSHDLSPDESVDEPGPRLSEEIWNHIWSRVLRAEQLEDNLSPSSPHLYRLDPDSETRSTISLPQLRPLLSASVSQPMPITSHSSATSSTTDLRTTSKSPSLASPSDPGTPDTSQASLGEAASKANALMLPGLGSPSLIPVLAKVEFDVDRRKATWYEPWIRSRKANHAKRVRRKTGNDTAEEGTHKIQHPLAPFLTGTKDAALPEDEDFSDEEDSESNSDDENVTARVGVGKVAEAHTTKKTKKRVVNCSFQPKAVQTSPEEPSLHGINEDELDGYNRVRSPEESEKRVGAIYEDLDLGLDPTEDYNDDDPYDKRRSQFLMSAKLDEIERAMLQLSPRALKTSREGDSSPIQQSPSKATRLSPSPSKMLPNKTLPTPSPEWPAVPLAPLKQSMDPATLDGPIAPPQLAVNGIATDARMTDVPQGAQHRRNDLEAGRLLAAGEIMVSDSPIPLPPDPFGRYAYPLDDRMPLSAAYENMPLPPVPYYPFNDTRQGIPANRTRTSTRTAVTSRFSADSTDEVIAKPSNRATIMSVKGIKRLWRRSDKSSQSADHSASAPSAGRASPSQSFFRPEKPSKEETDLPPIPDLVPSPEVAGFAIHGRTSTEKMSVPPTPTAFMAPASQLDGFHFNQESPYPTRVPNDRYSPLPTPYPPLPPEPEKTVRKSILKWATKSRGASISQANAEPRASSDYSRPSSRASGVIDGLRSKKSSIGGLILGHVSAQSTDIIPPSPKLPEQLLVGPRQATPLPTVPPVLPSSKRQSTSNGKLPRSSISSQLNLEHHLRSSSRSSSYSRRSMVSSRDSHSSRPSFDASQFEMVSPKALALAYPFHELDH